MAPLRNSSPRLGEQYLFVDEDMVGYARDRHGTTIVRRPGGAHLGMIDQDAPAGVVRFRGGMRRAIDVKNNKSQK